MFCLVQLCVFVSILVRGGFGPSPVLHGALSVFRQIALWFSLSCFSSSKVWSNTLHLLVITMAAYPVYKLTIVLNTVNSEHNGPIKAFINHKLQTSKTQTQKSQRHPTQFRSPPSERLLPPDWLTHFLPRPHRCGSTTRVGTGWCPSWAWPTTPP